MLKWVVNLNDQYMTIKNGKVVWTSKDKANTYPSKYAAKKHLRILDNIPDNIELEQI